MERTTFSTSIDAPCDKVWDILWQDETYSQWTAVFAEGSSVETDWQKGSKVLFTDGKGSGMVSFIDDIVPNEFMSFKHMGELKNSVENMAETAWTGSMENYHLKNMNGKTELTVEIDINDEFKEYFVNTFPKALAKVKELSEQ